MKTYIVYATRGYERKRLVVRANSEAEAEANVFSAGYLLRTIREAQPNEIEEHQSEEVTARTMASARDLGMKYLGKGTKVTRVVLTN